MVYKPLDFINFKDKIKIYNTFLFIVINNLIDGFGKFYIFTSSKQTEDFIIVFFAAIGILPIVINFYTQNIFKRYFRA